MPLVLAGILGCYDTVRSEEKNPRENASRTVLWRTQLKRNRISEEYNV